MNILTYILTYGITLEASKLPILDRLLYRARWSSTQKKHEDDGSQTRA